MKTYQPTLDDMVFEHRNREYGAYELRKKYQATLRKAALLGVGIVTIGIGSSFVYLKAHKNDRYKIVSVERKLTDLGVPEDAPPPEAKPTPPPPPPPPVEQKQLAMTAFLPPVPVETPEIEDIMPPQNELTDVVIGTKNVEGTKTDGIAFVEPPPLLQDPDIEVTGITTTEEAPFLSVEMMPEFEGGNRELYRWLSQNLNYPSAAARNNIQGKVFLNFIVEKDGSISHAKVLKGIGFGCDEEALRVVTKMPKWKAGRQNGNLVRVSFTLPINFQLE